MGGYVGMGVELKCTVGGWGVLWSKLLHERFLCSSGGFSAHDRYFSLLAGLCRSGSRTANRDNDVSRKPGQRTSPSAAGFHCPVLVTTHDSPPTPHHMTNSRDICRLGKRNCIETTHNYMSPN